MSKIMVIAAHPDDEILGCGGSIAKWVKSGHEVQVVIAAEGLTSRDDADHKTLAGELTQLKNVAIAANAVLGIKKVHFLSFPDNRMDSVPLLDIIKPIEKLISAFKPDTVVTHHPGDVNVDHKLLFEAVITATRPLPGESVTKVLCFEVASSTGWFSNLNQPPFNPQYFVSIGACLQSKLDALNVYAQEMRPYPHARSIENLKNTALVRGAQTGVDAAEAFQVARILEV